MTSKTCSLLVAALLFSACQKGPEAEIEDRLGELVSALNDHDTAAASRLFKGGMIPAVDNIGDSSVVYRLLHIPGSEDIELAGVTSTVIDQQARAEVELRGKVRRGDSVVGEMMLPLKLDLERDPGGQWLIVP